MKRSMNHAAAFALAASAFACGYGASPARQQPSGLEAEGGIYVQTNLVSDGFVAAKFTDPDLKNGWGLAALPASPWWVSDNGSGLATLYDKDGVKQARVVTIPGAGGAQGTPTGVMANTTGDFPVTLGATTAPARFIFAGEDGTISAWTLTDPPSAMAAIVVDNSASGAVQKGLAVASTPGGSRLYVTNFHEGTVEVYDGSFAPAPSAGFVDPGIPAGFAPFGIRAIGELVYVTYAMQDADREDDVAGQHLGYVSAFGLDGTFLRRIASRGKLNAPWGLALAPSDFGRHSGRLLVGNFGDGHIVSFAADGSEDDDGGGAYLTAKGGRVTIDGLWGISFGNGAAAGPTNALFFAAGPGDEEHGLFGRIDFMPAN